MDFFDTNTDTEVEQTTVTSLVDELEVAETSDGQSLFTLDEFQVFVSRYPVLSTLWLTMSATFRMGILLQISWPESKKN